MVGKMTQTKFKSQMCLALSVLAGVFGCAHAQMVRQIKVLPDKAADTSSLQSIVQSVTRGAKSNDEKAIALYNFDTLANYHRAYPNEPGGIEALKQFNVYGWSLCGGLHSGLGALYREMGWEWRFVGWNNPGHTTIEAKYDGQWHYLDTFLKFYVWKKDPNAPSGRTIASQDDIKRDASLVTNLVFDKSRKVYYQPNDQFEIVGDKANWAAPAFLVCGDEPSGILSGIKSNNVAGSPTSWESIKFDGPYSTDVNLAPGYSLTLNWSAAPDAYWWEGHDEAPGHTCGDKDYRNSPALGPILEPYIGVGGAARGYANGTLLFAPDFSNAACLSGLTAQDNVQWQAGRLVPKDIAQAASITVRLQSPYVITRAAGLASGADRIEISTDNGTSWKAIELKDFSAEARGQYDVLVKLAFRKALTALRLEATVQHNRAVAPYLSPGKNVVTVSAADAKQLGDNKLVVTYAYESGFRSKSFEEIAEREANVGQGLYATWSPTPIVVQKAFTAQNLPQKFTIDVPTPQGKYPVYPRMLFMRREIVPQNSKPLPLPEGAIASRVASDNELQTLPNPFLIGAALPPAKVARPITTRRIELKSGPVVSEKGELFPADHVLRWYKDNSVIWVLLIGGEIKDLPSPRAIAGARLVLPVALGHEKAPTRLDVMALNKAFTPDATYDLKNLGEALGSVVIDEQPAGLAAYNPPKEFKMDITRYIKTLAAGEAKFQGCALRVVPDRGIDDGWTVKAQLAKDAPLYLEIDVYADTPQ